MTLCIMPANARAVYAPREKPNIHILSFVRSGDSVSPFLREGGRFSMNLQFSIKNS